MSHNAHYLLACHHIGWKLVSKGQELLNLTRTLENFYETSIERLFPFCCIVIPGAASESKPPLIVTKIS